MYTDLKNTFFTEHLRTTASEFRNVFKTVSLNIEICISLFLLRKRFSQVTKSRALQMLYTSGFFNSTQGVGMVEVKHSEILETISLCFSFFLFFYYIPICESEGSITNCIAITVTFYT